MTSSAGKLAGRRVLITGAGSGIGRATARLFVEQGATVGLIDRDAAALAVVAAELGSVASHQVADVSIQPQVDAAVTALAASLGGLDSVVNAAGISRSRPFEQTTVDDWRATLAVNLDGPFFVCRACLPWLRDAGHGTIVNIASGVALRPISGTTAYAASKAGLIGFGKALAIEMAPLGVRVNTVCPGIVETPMMRARFERAADPEEEKRRLFERRLIRRLGQPEEIAQAILFLTADDCSYVTGSVFAIDGGGTMY